MAIRTYGVCIKMRYHFSHLTNPHDHYAGIIDQLTIWFVLNGFEDGV
jgi:hypothetical protein